MNVYRAADGAWFVLILRAPQFAEAVAAMGRPELVSDPRFADAAAMSRHMSELSAIFDETFAAQPMAHWHDLFAELDVTFGEIRGPADVIADPQLTANEIVVPLAGGGSKLTSTISSPFKVHGVEKVAAHAAPAIGQHTEQVLAELGFDASAISQLREAGAVPTMPGKTA